MINRSMHRHELEKVFCDLFGKLSERHGRHKVWSDFITMSACAISNSSDYRHFDEREKMYFDAIKNYSKNELEVFATTLDFLLVMSTVHDDSFHSKY